MGDNCTADTVNFAKDGAKLGVDGFMCVVPYYNKPPQEGLYQHFSTIARSVELPIILYNIPGRCAVNMTAETSLRLAHDLDNVVAIKEASGSFEQVKAIVEGAPEGSPVCGLGLLPGTVVAMPRCDAQGKAFKVPHVGWNTIEMPACNGGDAVPPCGEGGGNAVLKQSSLRCGTARGTSPDSAALLDGGQAEPELSSLRSENAGGAFPNSASQPESELPFPGSAPQAGSEFAFACPLFDGIAPGESFYFTHSYIAPTGSHTIAETTHSTRFTSAVQFGECAFGVQFHPEKSSDAGARVLANVVAIAARG